MSNSSLALQGGRKITFSAYAFVLQLPAFPCPEGLNCPGSGSVGGVGTINSAIGNAISWLVSIAFGVTLLFLIYGGFLYIFSGGDEERAEKARGTIFNALIGLVIIILSYVVVSFVVNTAGTIGEP